MLSRRSFLKSIATASAVAALPTTTKLHAGTLSGSTDSSQDESYWQQVRAHYELPSDIIQLENGNWGVMSQPVMAAYIRHTFKVNRDSSYYSRREFGTDYINIRRQVADLLGAEPEEIALARGASEVLTNLIAGYRHLNKGDAALYADVDYDSMQSSMDALQHKGVKLIRLALPERATQEEYVAVYRQALEQHPKIKLVLLTHLSHRHGQILPIKELTALCKQYGADCIIDAAHSWGQLDFKVGDLEADFVGFNLHKWLGAPLGVGVMYIRKTRLHDIAPATGEPDNSKDRIQSRIHTGTFNYAAWLTVPEALQFHHVIGAQRKAARLTYLRQYWNDAVRPLKDVQLLTLTDNSSAAGIHSFRIAGNRSIEANKAIASRLHTDFGIFTVHRNGLHNGACVRVTPGVFTLTSELDKLAVALKTISG